MMIANILGCLSLIGWVYLALFNGRFWRPLFADSAVEPAVWPSIDIIVPARDEADILPGSLPSLLQQDYQGPWRVLLVDDHSDDGTAELARKLATQHSKLQHLEVITAPDLPPGWSGKVAAMQAGAAHSNADYILFTDADIWHPANSLSQLAARAVEKKLDLTSLMVKLHCREFAEELLIPAFVFFFAMLYPFASANDEDSSVAAAAGGVMLVRRKALNNIGGLASIKSALIDDCSLAKNIKNFGGNDQTAGRIELTLARSVKSIRPYPDIASIWRMIARSAFTQLRHSFLLLLGTVLGMGLLFIVPFILPLTSGMIATMTGLLAALIMIALYAPMVLFYDLPLAMAATLPVAGIIYILATVDSARLYWQGKGGQWKGRTQA